MRDRRVRALHGESSTGLALSDKVGASELGSERVSTDLGKERGQI